MPVDPRTPVLIGSGQVNQHDDAAGQLEPVDLMVTATQRAADATVLASFDAIRVVNLLTRRYPDPGRLLAQRIGAPDAKTRYTGVGGNVPQTLVNQACLDIQRGRAGVVMLAGAESWRPRMRYRAQGTKPNWPPLDESIPAGDGADDGVPMVGPAENRIQLHAPANVYPLFEQALRIAAGETSDVHRKRIGELWSQFSAVAVDNPHAWSRKRLTAEQIWQPGPTNRMISWPYTKLMNSNNIVDQAAVLILTSAENAERLRIPSDRWVFPHAGTDSHDTYAIAAAELGLPVGEVGRPLTVTGDLTFAGGPWNNYVMHSIATMAEQLVANPGQRGLITANGGYLTKHSFGVYGTEPPTEEFRWEDVQSEVDREPTRQAAVDWEGIGTVESWTTPFDREGNAEKAFLAVRTPDDSRSLAVITDPSEAAATVRDDIAGATVRVHADGTATLR